MTCCPCTPLDSRRRTEMADKVLKVSADGALTIPPEIAKSIGLQAGDEVVVQGQEDGFRVRRIRRPVGEVETPESGQRVLDWTEVERSRRDRP